MRLVALAAVMSLALTAAADDAADLKLLKSAGVTDDGPSLLDFFRKRTLDDENRDRIGKLIRRLGADEFTDRERAFADLQGVGATATALLRQAIGAADQDVEIARSCERLLKKIETTPGNALAAAAARAAAKHKPDGLAEVLFAYLPFADDADVIEDVEAALTAVNTVKEKPNPTLEAALTDKSPARRGIAAEALLTGGKDTHPAAKALLTDPDAVVRMRVALALVKRKDRDALPVLVELIAALPADKMWRPEEPLLQLAGDAAPPPPAVATAEARGKYRDAWDAWYRKEGVKVDLARLDNPPLLGYTLISAMDQQFVNGTVTELGKDNKVRWQVKGLQFPVDAQVLNGGERILVAETNGMRVTERTTADGKVQWERRFQAQPIAVRRLSNGNTFVACQNQLVEIDRAGKEVLAYNRPNYDIMGAVKARNGDAVFVTSTGQCVRVDAAGKTVKSFGIGQAGTYSGIDLLPSGNIVVPQFNMAKVVEYDRDGKQVWEAAVQQPTAVQRLPDGNTLVSSMTGTITEFDAKGKQVAQMKADGRPWRVSRR